MRSLAVVAVPAFKSGALNGATWPRESNEGPRSQCRVAPTHRANFISFMSCTRGWDVAGGGSTRELQDTTGHYMPGVRGSWAVLRAIINVAYRARDYLAGARRLAVVEQ